MFLSIITPSYNHAAFIADAILSVDRQDFTDYEHLILDDGSTDNSVTLISSLKKNGVFSQQNSGLATTLNNLLERSCGEWIGWLNSDDFYMQAAFSRLKKTTQRYPDVELIIGDTLWVDSNGSIMRLMAGHRLYLNVLKHYGMFCAPSSFFVRGDILRNITFRNDTKFLMDKWLFADLLIRKTRSLYVPIPFGVMRRHLLQESTRLKGEQGNHERAQFRQEFGLPASGTARLISKSLGRLMHISEKAINGGYIREMAYRNKRGKDARWWNRD